MKQLPLFIRRWFKQHGWTPHPHQREILDASHRLQNVLLVAPTGGGKTLAGFLPSLIDIAGSGQNTLHTLYISPLKSLTSDIQRNLMLPITEMGLSIRVETRTGDTPPNRRKRQFIKPPQILLTTPESLELILSYTEAPELLKDLKRIIVDEVHAMAAGKRGDLTALCIAQICAWNPDTRVTGLSATIADPLMLGNWLGKDTRIIIAPVKTKPHITILSAQQRIPWSGYMALYAIPEIYQAVLRTRTSIIFVNTRAQAELLFQALWNYNSENLSIALHHGSLTKEHRHKVEAMMASGTIRAVIATASLDLGLDWAAVDLVIQVGAPKAISRLLQRIGRSNHQLNKPSEALLVPCNRFEVLECQAVIDAIAEGGMDGEPLSTGGMDVLVQFTMNMACGNGFDREEFYRVITSCYPYRQLKPEEWQQVIDLCTDGGYVLKNYERFHRIGLLEDGKYHALNTRIIQRHRMNIGTIVEYQTMRVKLMRKKSAFGRDLGQVEEYFVQGLQLGDTFLLAGRVVAFDGIDNNNVMVRAATAGKPKIPSFVGGRLPLSISLAERVKALIYRPAKWQTLPLPVIDWLKLQQVRSMLPEPQTLLIETFPHQRRYYMMVYSFSGRSANQTLGLLLSRHMEKQHLMPLGFAASDYALCLWGMKPVNAPEALLDFKVIAEEGNSWLSESFMAKRAFREICIIAGMVERHYPGANKTGRQVTFSTDLLYDTLMKYEPQHLLLEAASRQARGQLAEFDRLEMVLQDNTLIHRALPRSSPLSIPLMVEIGIEKISGEAESYLLRQLEREAMGDQLLEAS